MNLNNSFKGSNNEPDWQRGDVIEFSLYDQKTGTVKLELLDGVVSHQKKLKGGLKWNSKKK